MKKVKLRFITIIALFTLFAVVFGFAIGALRFDRASAATSYEPTSVFSQGTGGEVAAYKESDGEDAKAYTAFVISDGGYVYYRRNLALKWYEGVITESDETEDEEDNENGTETQALADEPANPAEVVYYAMTFRFVDINFDTLTIKFESAEENVTKDGKASNSVIFMYDSENDTLTAEVENSEKEKSEPFTVTNKTGWITLSIDEGAKYGVSENEIGEFFVYLDDGSKSDVKDTFVGKLTNVGSNYLEYRSSAATTPSTPMTFSTEIAESKSTQKILFSQLNGQTLEVTEGTAADTAEDDGTVKVTEGVIVDNRAPALVLDEKVYAFTLGQKYNLTPVAIDVCKDTVTVSRYYYMYAERTEKDEDSEEETVILGEDKDSYATLTTSTYFLPKEDLAEGEEKIYVSIRFKLDDSRTLTENELETYVYLTWYAADGAAETVDGFDYIVVDREKEGPNYVGLTANKETCKNDVEESVYTEAVEAYQEAVTAAAKNVSAGSGAYFYLPSLRGLITSAYADYRNLKFSVYYYKQTQTGDATATSATSLAYNALRFEIDEEGTYKFRVLATDASSNSMKYYSEGLLVTVSSSNIWDIEEIPEFTFEARYTGVTIEPAGEQTLGYRDTTYSITDFEIVALDGIEKEYTLYRFDASMLPEGVPEPTYSSLVEEIADYIKDEKYAACFKEISPYNSEITEDDDEWDETDNRYYWQSDSLSFLPVESGYYVVELLVIDPNRSNEPTTAYQVIDVQNPFDYTPGVSQWLQNNVTSIVLFSVSAVLLVVIVILFVVKPSEKKVEEIDLEKLKGKKKERK